MWCFNPRPAWWPGAALVNNVGNKLTLVSILARLGGRALHGRSVGWHIAVPVSILARLGGRALRALGDYLQQH